MILQKKYLDSVKITSVNYDELIGALKRISGKIREQYSFVAKIFLFGSFYKRNFTPESDLDILIIVKHTDIPFLERRDLFLDFFKDIPFDLNILVYSEKETKKMLKEGNLFIENIMKESINL